jgi:transglutaminase-like putative cysteine protease
MEALAAQPWVPRWPGWRNLPREARDTLFQLGVIGWLVAPHLLRLPLWCGVLVAVILAWRARLAVANAPLPSRWAVAGVLVAAAALTVWSEGTLLGKEAGVTMLVVLMALKMLELRARRDAMVVFFLGFFIVLTHFLYSQSLVIALSTLVSVWGLLTALVLSNMPVGSPTLRQAGTTAARTALFAAPLMVVLFVLFPRVAPLWGLPQDAAGKTGLSGTLRMGGVADLANDESVAMRVRFFGRTPPPEALYFRGPVLSRFDGRDWTRLAASLTPHMRSRTDLQLNGAPLRYEVTLEPSRMNLLPLLDVTPDRPDSAPQIDGMIATLRPDLQWQTNQPVTDRLRFEAQAWPIYRLGPRTPIIGMHELVALPKGYNPRTLEWAAAMKREPRYAEADARTLAQALYKHIGGDGYTYTLEPGAYGRDAVDEFWLDRKLGFCEHYASSFVVIMRALGVPARIVTGYQGTDPEPVDGYWTVRQSHAHAWAEYWQAGEGWVRADPTAAVAPERIRRSRQLQRKPGIMEQAIGTVSPELMSSLRSMLSKFDNQWNQWVLNYSKGRQFSLLKELGIESPDWTNLAYILIALLCSASLAGAGWALWDRQRQDPWQRLQQRVQRRLAALGVQVHMHDGPRARGQRVHQSLGAPGQELASLLEGLEQARYGRQGRARVDRQWWSQFQAAAARLPNRANRLRAAS